MVVFFVKSNENVYQKGRTLLQCPIVPSCPYNEKRELNEEADITLTQSHLKFGG